MRNRRYLRPTLLLLWLALVGCQRQTVYHQYHHAPDTGWGKTDTLYFDIPPVKETGIYHGDVELRIVKTYPFQKLALVVGQTVFPGSRHYDNTLICSLIDARGTIMGDGISYFHYRFPLGDISLSQGESVRVSIIHDMKREIIPGIADMGFHLTKKGATQVSATD